MGRQIRPNLSKNRQKNDLKSISNHEKSDFGGSGGVRRWPLGPSGPPGMKKCENVGSRVHPGSHFGDHFGTKILKSRKKHEKVSVQKAV